MVVRRDVGRVRLAELEPTWVGEAGRHGTGLACNCPCGCDNGLYVPFANPLDGGLQVGPQGWQRTGDTFETLTLTPSIFRRGEGSCGWHGFIRAGEVVKA